MVMRSLSVAVGAPLRKKITMIELGKMYKKREKISMMTAYDYPSAVHVDGADIEMLLVGDSVAMVSLGHDTTQPVTVDEMLHHCKAVARGATRPFLVGFRAPATTQNKDPTP